MAVFVVDEQKVRVTCPRCGVDEMVKQTTLYKRLFRGSGTWAFCSDCEIQHGRNGSFAVQKSDCQPHKGELDDSLRPLDKFNNLYRPGLRVCGKSDCVKRDHVREMK